MLEPGGKPRALIAVPCPPGQAVPEAPGICSFLRDYQPAMSLPLGVCVRLWRPGEEPANPSLKLGRFQDPARRMRGQGGGSPVAAQNHPRSPCGPLHLARLSSLSLELRQVPAQSPGPAVGTRGRNREAKTGLCVLSAGVCPQLRPDHRGGEGITVPSTGRGREGKARIRGWSGEPQTLSSLHVKGHLCKGVLTQQLQNGDHRKPPRCPGPALGALG